MDVEKTIEFILNHQAQFVVRLDRVEAQVEALARQTQGLMRVAAEQQNQITTILGILETLTQRVDTLTQRMDTLAETFEQWLRRNGDGSRPT